MSEEYKPTSAIVSNCRDCVFAEYESPPKGNDQTGCAADRFSYLTSRPGVQLELVEDPPGTPNPRSFYVIDGAYCSHKRHEPWKGDAEKVRQEMLSRMKVRLFVIADKPEIEAIATTVETASSFDVISVVPGENPPPRPVVAVWLSERSPVKWTLDWFGDAVRDWPRLIDDAVSSCDSQFYVVCKAGQMLPSGLADSIKQAVVIHDKAFLALEGDGYQVVQTKAHQAIGGNLPVEAMNGAGRQDSVVDKLKHAALDKGLKFVFPAGDVLV